MNLYLYIAWGVLYLVCAALGVFPVQGWVGTLMCLVFFAPPAILLYRAPNRKTVQQVRNLSIAWLALTVFLLILNILSVSMSEQAGTILYYMMVVLTAPMICGGNWLLAIFLWACLLVVSRNILKKMK